MMVRGLTKERFIWLLPRQVWEKVVLSWCSSLKMSPRTWDPSYLDSWLSPHGHKVIAAPLTITPMFPLNKGKGKRRPERSGKEEGKGFSSSQSLPFNLEWNACSKDFHLLLIGQKLCHKPTPSSKGVWKGEHFSFPAIE